MWLVGPMDKSPPPVTRFHRSLLGSPRANSVVREVLLTRVIGNRRESWSRSQECSPLPCAPGCLTRNFIEVQGARQARIHVGEPQKYPEGSTADLEMRSLGVRVLRRSGERRKIAVGSNGTPVHIFHEKRPQDRNGGYLSAWGGGNLGICCAVYSAFFYCQSLG